MVTRNPRHGNAGLFLLIIFIWCKHNAAAVGPFHPVPLYFKVNHEGTLSCSLANSVGMVPLREFSPT